MAPVLGVPGNRPGETPVGVVSMSNRVDEPWWWKPWLGPWLALQEWWHRERPVSAPVRSTEEELDRWFPKRGQCQICGTPGADQRHRRIDAIADAVAAGEDEQAVADDLEVPLEAVKAAVAWAKEHPGEFA